MVRKSKAGSGGTKPVKPPQRARNAAAHAASARSGKAPGKASAAGRTRVRQVAGSPSAVASEPNPPAARRGRRTRTPPPPPVAAEQARGREGAASRLKQLRLARAAQAEAVPAPLDQATPRRRGRTPPPPAAATEEQGPLQGGALTELTGKMAERLEQLRYLQDFFHNPVPFDLRDKPLPTSSEPEELTRRVAEVDYQIHVLEALIQVLREELKELNRALLPKTEAVEEMSQA